MTLEQASSPGFSAIAHLIGIDTMASGRVNFGNVVLEKQAELAWCYAQTVSVLSRHLAGANGWRACQIASLHLHQSIGIPAGPKCNCCVASKDRPNCCSTTTAVAPMRQTFLNVGIGYSRNPGCPGSNLIIQEITANRPILFTVDRNGAAAGHTALIIGFNDDPRPGDLDRTDMLTIYDPSAQNIPFFNQRADMSDCTIKLSLKELYAQYPTKSYSVKHHYYNFGAGPNGFLAPPGWAA